MTNDKPQPRDPVLDVLTRLLGGAGPGPVRKALDDLDAVAGLLRQLLDEPDLARASDVTLAEVRVDVGQASQNLATAIQRIRSAQR